MSLTNLSFFTLLSAVAVGLYLVMVGFRQKKRMPALGLTHAGLAIAAIAILFMAIFEGPSSKLNNAGAFFLLLALIGGGLVFLLHEEKKPPSMAAVVFHAVMGLIGLTLLLLNVTA
jgi:hypothetical protein